MKTRLKMAAALLLAALAIGAKADYTTLTVKENSGTWTSYALTNLRITFSADQMTLTNFEQTAVYTMADLYSLLFTDLPTAVEKAAQMQTVVSLQGARVQLNVAAGTLAEVFDSSGKRCATARIGQEGVPVYIGDLVPGIYILKAGKERHKILVKP